MNDTSILWPVAGLIHFLSRPKLWPGALIANFLAWVITLLLAIVVCWWTWPVLTQDIGWFAFMINAGLAFGWGMLAFLVGWMVLVPIVLGMAYEKLTRRILLAEGHEVIEEGSIAAARSAVVFVFKTLHWRLGWLVLGLLPLLIGLPPLSWLIATVALGHVALLDACDTALAMRGHGGAARARLIGTHRREMLLGGLGAGIAGQALGSTVIGWLFWMPGLYVAAARECPSWGEVERPAIDTSATPAEPGAAGESSEAPPKPSENASA
jgi:hypothetical protein